MKILKKCYNKTYNREDDKKTNLDDLDMLEI